LGRKIFRPNGEEARGVGLDAIDSTAE